MAQTVRNLLAKRETQGLIPGSVRCPREGNGNPLQYSYLENPMDREAWQDRWGHKESRMSKYREIPSCVSVLKYINSWGDDTLFIVINLLLLIYCIFIGIAEPKQYERPLKWGVRAEDTEKAMAPHSSVLAWRIPGTAQPGGLPSIRLHRIGHGRSNLAAAAAEGRVGKISQVVIICFAYITFCLPECLKRCSIQRNAINFLTLTLSVRIEIMWGYNCGNYSNSSYSLHTQGA